MIELGYAGDPTNSSCQVYNYYSGVGNPTSCATPGQATTGNNGNVKGYWCQNVVYPSLHHTASYSYDNVNRLMQASATPFGSGTVSYSQSYNYTSDSSNGQYGNMQGTLGSTGYCPQVTFSSTTNRITTSGYSYDAAGNMTGDGTHTYQWGGEGRMNSVDSGSTATFTYNALGQRVRDVSSTRTTDEAFDPSGQLIWRYTGVQN